MSFLHHTSELHQSAQAAFVLLCAQANLKADAYGVGAEWIKDDKRRLHIVQRYDADGCESVVLKHALRPDDQDAFKAVLEAHQYSSDALNNHPTAQVPRILAHDQGTKSYLMEFFAGETVLALCRRSSDHTPFLTAAGAWLSAYHDATFQEERAFQPKFMVRHMRHLADQLSRGERKIRGQKRFVSLAYGMEEHVGGAEGYIGKVAAKHGDLNAHNILIESDQTVALDFLARSTAPVAYDIARFLLSYMQMVGDIGAVPKGHVLPPAAMDAFFHGYTFVGQDDPTVHFLMRIQILTDWNRRSDNMTLSNVLRFDRLKKIARQTFA